MKKQAQAIYRIVNDTGKDDVDMTRVEALRVYRDLHRILFPRPTPTRKGSR